MTTFEKARRHVRYILDTMADGHHHQVFNGVTFWSPPHHSNVRTILDLVPIPESASFDHRETLRLP